MMIGMDWEDLQWTNSPRDISICYAHCFQLNLDETCFLCNEGELNIIGGNDKPFQNKKLVIRGFQLQSSGLGVQRE